MKAVLRGWRSLPVTSRIGIGIVAVIGLVSIFAHQLAPYDPHMRTGAPFGHPSAGHWLGTDDVGHDLLSLILVGGQPSLLVGFVAAAVATGIGMIVGLVAGFLRGAVDTVLMRIVDVVMSLPVVPLTLVVGVLAGPGLVTEILVISLAMWAPLARELRSQVLSLRERDHIQALRAMGARNGYLLVHHVVPAVAVLVVPQLVLAIKAAVMLEASLAFLGLGDINTMSWGMILSIASARSAFLTDAWLWWVLPPGALIGITVLGFALAGGAVERTPGAVALRRSRSRWLPRARTAPSPAPLATSDASELVIDDLTVRYRTRDGAVGGCMGVGLTLPRGEVLGLVGESGSGKSTVAAAIIGLLPPAAEVAGGRILLDGIDLLGLTDAERRALRGDRIGLVPQEAQSALNPVHRVGAQIVEAIQAHRKASSAQAKARAVELLGLVGLPAAKFRAYPHQLSGGQRQRAVIAIAIARDPELLVADEPTSGIDVLLQQEILELLASLGTRLRLAIVIVTHDLPVVAAIADRIAVMRAGEIVEQGATAQVLASPRHPYTRGLLDSLPDLADFEAVPQ